MIMNDIITVTEAAQLLELTPQRVRTMCKQGALMHINPVELG